MKLTKLLFIGLFVLYSNLAFSLTLTKVENLESLNKLDRSQGYLLVKLEANEVKPKFKFSEMRVKKQTYLQANQKPLLKNKTVSAAFNATEPGYYLARVKAGLYQIKEINAPYFNLPYRLSTNLHRDWRFSIKAGQINYIGLLSIDAQRSTRSVEINLVTRIATDEAEIKELFSENLEQYPLRNGSGKRDDFYTQYMSE